MAVHRHRTATLLATLALIASGTGAAALAGDAPPNGPAAPVDPPVAAGASAGPSPPRWAWPVLPAPAVVARYAAGPHRWSPGHRGVDLAVAPGSAVGSAGVGVVAFAGRVAGRGVVSVQHAGGLRTTYEPVRALVGTGTPVAAGAPLGVLEATGSHCAPAPCLHWGLRRGRAYLDPLSLLRPAAPPVLLPLPR